MPNLWDEADVPAGSLAAHTLGLLRNLRQGTITGICIYRLINI